MTDKKTKKRSRAASPSGGASASEQESRPRGSSVEKKSAAQAKASAAAKPRRSWGLRIFLWFFTLLVGGGIVGILAVVLAFWYFAQNLPPVDSLKNYRPKTVTFFYSDDGRVIGEYSHERRIVVPLAKVPQHVRQAFIAAEDANFYNHPGVDFSGVLRAAYRNFLAGEITQGASTITMQVARSFFLTRAQSYVRKMREAVLAYRISQNLTKDEVLFLYMNHIYLGHGAHGIESAAELYFDKHVNQLTIAEAALIAGLAPRPSDYSPFAHPQKARKRQLYVIRRMVENNFITPQQAEEAVNQKLRFIDRPNVNLKYTPYFTEHVRRILEEKYGEERLYNDGFRVYTTVNVEMQAAARRAVRKGLREFSKRRKYRGPLEHLEDGAVKEFLAAQTEEMEGRRPPVEEEIQAVVIDADYRKHRLKVQAGPYEGYVLKDGLRWVLGRGEYLKNMIKPGDVILVQAIERTTEENKKKGAPAGAWLFSLEQKPQVHSALLSIEANTGAAKALVGGRDFQETQFNRAIQSRRQPGSSFKPIIYTAAMDNGFTPGSILIDSPIVYDDFAHNRRWKPTNYDRKFYGPTDLYTGLTSSRNVMAIKLLDKVGYEAVFDYARRLGITSPLVENLSLALGSAGVSLEEMVTVFSTFPNLGERVEPMYITRIEDRDGDVVHEFLPTHIRAISPQTACVMLSLLRGVVLHGTGVRVKALERPAAGKTGTTNDLADAWFMGFTPELVTGVWVGRDEMKRMGWGESGGRAAAPIFLYYMKEVLEGEPVRDFDWPEEGVEYVNIGKNRICYKAGTIGTGYSEAAPSSSEDFLKDELLDKDL